MQCHPLRRLRADAGQTAQRLRQFLEAPEWLHQNGSLKPGGSGRPAVRPAIFSCDAASTLRTASLIAAATRSSSISLSSPSKLGSMLTRFTSRLQVIVTLTMPAPD